jgi:hypothetical protein
MFSTVGRPTAISRRRHSAPVSTRRKRSGPVAYPGSVASRAHHAGFRIDLAGFDAVGSVFSLSVVSRRTHQPHICLPLTTLHRPAGGLVGEPSGTNRRRHGAVRLVAERRVLAPT